MKYGTWPTLPTFFRRFGGACKICYAVRLIWISVCDEGVQGCLFFMGLIGLMRHMGLMCEF